MENLEVDIPFMRDSRDENELMDAFTSKINSLHKSEMEYHGKIVHILGRIQKISLMSIIEICYINYPLATQTVAPTLSGFQGTNRCIQYLDSCPHKSILYPSNYYDGSNFIRFTWS